MSLAAVVQKVTESTHHPPVQHDSPNTSPDDDDTFNQPTVRLPPLRLSHFRNPPDTPSARTGPPRSLSYTYTLPSSAASRGNSKYENGNVTSPGTDDAEFSPQSTFRSVLEYGTPEMDRKGKRRERTFDDRDGWSFMHWFYDSPKDEAPPFDSGVPEKEDRRETGEEITSHKKSIPGEEATTPTSRKSVLRRAVSGGHPSQEPKSGGAMWSRIRSLIPQIIHHDASVISGPSVTSHTVNITDELITGGLSTLMLRLWFERDEKDHRRIPVLLHRLRIRVTDSLHPMHAQKSVFRIECEYANGAARWVVYRQLRDFLSLHGHYAVANVYNRHVQVDQMPEFPRTSLPYLKFLKKEGRVVGHADFARLQRESLENYLLDLIRAVMFHPSSNRLAGFLEISALSISLAQSGGVQYKAGLLQIESINNGGGGFGHKSAGRKARKQIRWCAVRESYLVAMEEPGELHVWDVFLLDSTFDIERPKRYYRQGLTILHDISNDAITTKNGSHVAQDDHMSLIGSIKSKVSKIFHMDGHQRAATTNGANAGDRGYAPSSLYTIPRPSPMLDPSTNFNPLSLDQEQPDESHEPQRVNGKKRSADVSKHTFYIVNAQMRLKLCARNERQMLQWITAFEKAKASSNYANPRGNRFDSFAPIRLNVAAQWLVDGRDYFWNLSRAILLARESIYIHDWWLSPEVQLRRPNKDRYRLDRLLERKAKEGVKIYIILYQEVSSRYTPTDSNYSKQRLVSLHPNIMVQRSPSHFQTGTFYWAHHEKMCVIDQVIAFMGGLDLCFGRWDTPQHVLTDDMEDTEQSEIWPGKDYSNPRLSDFYDLHKPEEDMYDRRKVPRMPWHDVGMQVVGQPARDLARHFVQRWNYLLRIKNHTRMMPSLLPPPEFRPGELPKMGLTGTCEMQICRSAGPWSLGTPGKTEKSIQNAYLKAIQLSEHFVYIENQFFITSTVVNDVNIDNNIGNAIVHRIIRAHRDGTPWKCCVMIPLLPGFTFPVDHNDASAVRIIMECQNCTISRGPYSIFAQLRREGIDPNEYISFFSLRNWAKVRGDVLTTEQVYIHSKVCIVDDRLAIIGSANINERSQRGERDSELAAVIRDTDMIDCTMAGKPYKVGRFAHTLRIRLMREHLGIDVDSLDQDDLMANDPIQPEHMASTWDPDADQAYGKDDEVTHIRRRRYPADTVLQNTLNSADQKKVGPATEEATSSTTSSKAGLVRNTPTMDAERKSFTSDDKEMPGVSKSVVPALEEKAVMGHRPPKDETDASLEKHKLQHQIFDEKPRREMPLTCYPNGAAKETPLEAREEDGTLLGAPANAATSVQANSRPPRASGEVDEEEKAASGARAKIRKHLSHKTWVLPTPKPHIDPEGFEDPISDAFWKNMWVAGAVHNTEIYRKVFHAIPDDQVTTWKQYKEFILHHERLNKKPRDSLTPERVSRVPSESGDDAVPDHGTLSLPTENTDAILDDGARPNKESNAIEEAHVSLMPPGSSEQEPSLKPKRSSKGVEPFEKWEHEEMEKLLGQLCGHLVVFPNHFLEGEDIANNFLFNADRLLPLSVYN